jgi:DNA-binding response OmpR family regulator
MEDKITNQEAKARILVVGDDPYSLDLIKLSLSTDGHDVETASSGDEALAAFETDAIDLILLDLSTTEDAALEVMKRLRAERSSTPPLILLTASGEHHAKKTRKRLGAVNAMVKPVTRGDLLDAVYMALNSSSHEDSAH